MQTQKVDIKRKVATFRTTHDFKLEKRDKEVNRGTSLTVPDESWTIKELLQKFTRGVDPSISKVATWDDDADHDDVDRSKTYELEELDEMKQENAKRLELLKQLRKNEVENAKKKDTPKESEKLEDTKPAKKDDGKKDDQGDKS